MPAEAPVAPPPPPAAAPDTGGKLPSTPVTQDQSSSFGEAFADLDKLAGVSEPAAEPGVPEAKEPTRPRDDTGKFTKGQPAKPPQPKAPEKPAAKEEPKVPEKPAAPEPEPEVEKMAPKQLREAYQNLRKKLSTIEKEHSELKTKSAQPQEDPEKKSLSEKVSNYEKRMAQLDEELRFTAYERSQEYKDKYEKPYVDAFLAGRSRIVGLKVVERRNPETEEVIQQARAATAEDFDNLMKIGDDDAAAEAAYKLFGEKAASVLYHRERVIELNSTRAQALEEFRKQGSEREKKRMEHFQAEEKMVRETWKRSNEDAVKKYPQWFAPSDDDPRRNELLERGMHMADRAFTNGEPIKEGDRPLSVQELTELRSALRNKAGAFDAAVHQLGKLKSRVADLEKQIADYEKSEPGPGDGKRAPNGDEPVMDDALSAFDAAFGKARR